MADATVWIDLDEVEAAAKKILGLLDELSGPANQLAAKVKQVKETVYGTDLVGKAIQGGSSSVGGIAEHQEQVLQGIQVLIQNATAVGENLQSMVARHRANDEQQAAALGTITGDGTMPAGPALAGLGTTSAGTVFSGAEYATPTLSGTAAAAPDHQVWPAETAQATPMLQGRPVETAQATPEYALRRPVETVEATPEYALRRPVETAEGTPVLQGRLMETVQATPAHPVTPPPPPPIEGLGNIDGGEEYHSAETPDLHYNTPPPPFIGPGMWAPTGHGV
ncbi:hypothetical protein Kpho02_00730 [Kitasatospora phosalacinea]|uniref:Uncharacterized protein n=1 Tax=Kitasatospora phosalacinea TaxID=2065 RepID=A0A9W6UXV9_9ACTN|nr:hypothetical protein [Kitasatospora phosalacinea]GLW67774.1 hypothetical protein Kpho02_00730 [Kitasatospora phosalacinea]